MRGSADHIQQTMTCLERSISSSLNSSAANLLKIGLQCSLSSNIVLTKLWCWRRLLKFPCTARKYNQAILKEISREYSLEGPMLKLNKLREMVKNRKTWCAAVHGVIKRMTWLSNWTTFHRSEVLCRIALHSFMGLHSQPTLQIVKARWLGSSQ